MSEKVTNILEKPMINTYGGNMYFNNYYSSGIPSISYLLAMKINKDDIKAKLESLATELLKGLSDEKLDELKAKVYIRTYDFNVIDTEISEYRVYLYTKNGSKLARVAFIPLMCGDDNNYEIEARISIPSLSVDEILEPLTVYCSKSSDSENSYAINMGKIIKVFKNIKE